MSRWYEKILNKTGNLTIIKTDKKFTISSSHLHFCSKFQNQREILNKNGI